jgi:hypothetical protein
VVKMTSPMRRRRIKRILGGKLSGKRQASVNGRMKASL